VATIYDLKPRFQARLRPAAIALATRGITPNQLTAAALALSAFGGLAITLWPRQPAPLLALPALLLLRMALNALDGMLAREFHQASRLGALLNELGDVLADVLLYLPLGLVAGVEPLLLALVVVLGVIGEMAGVVGVQIGGRRRYEGPLGKSDRAFAFGALALLVGLGVPAGTWTSLVLGVMVVLALLTIANRARRALAPESADP
jgi:CDP-diacylglycerol--glycerol-3-phosphate 3-phosphatidyltransferase